MTAVQNFYRENRVMVQKILLLFALILAVYIFITYVFQFVAPFVIGFIISLIVERPVRFFHKRMKIARGFGGLLMILVLLTLVSMLSIYLVSILITQGVEFITKVPDIAESIAKLFEDLQRQYEDILSFIPEGWSNLPSELFDQLKTEAAGIVGTGVKEGSTGIIRVVPNFIMYFIIIFISAFFFIKDREFIYGTISSLMPKKMRDAASAVKSGLFKALFGYIKAQLIIMLVNTSIITLGLTILGQPYSLFLGIGIAVIDALPIFGSGAAFWPWALYAAVTGNVFMAISLMIIYGIVFLTRQFLEPKILSSHIGLYPVLTLFSLFVGLKMFGVIGMFIGPMLTVTAKIILTYSPEPETSAELK